MRLENIIIYQEEDSNMGMGLIGNQKNGTKYAYVADDSKDIEKAMSKAHIYNLLCNDRTEIPKGHNRLFDYKSPLEGITKGLNFRFERSNNLTIIDCSSKMCIVGQPLLQTTIAINDMTDEDYKEFKQTVTENGYFVFLLSLNKNPTPAAYLLIESADFVEKI